MIFQIALLASTCDFQELQFQFDHQSTSFEQYRQWGLEKGFFEVVSGVLVRSSYRAEQVLAKNNVGLP